MRRCSSIAVVALVVPVGLALAACSVPIGPGGAAVTERRPVTARPAVDATPAGLGPTTEAVPRPASTATATGTVTIGWAGDAVPASTRQGLPRDPATLLGSVADELGAPDLMLVNLEGTLGRRGLSKCVRWNVRDCHAFQAPESYAARVFAATGVDAVSVANNHAFDYGPEGQRDTRSALEDAGVAVTGGAGEVTVLERAGVRVALVAAAPYTWCEDLRDEQHLVGVVRQARERADVVVVALHLGAEGTGAAHTPAHTEWYLGENRGNPRRLAHALVDAGADLVVGSGPHVVRGLEFYRGHLVAYSLGNLVGYGGAFQTSGDLALSGILDVELRGDGTFASSRLVPLRLGRDGVPRPDPDAATLRRVRALSASDFGADAAVVGRDGTVRPRR